MDEVSGHCLGAGRFDKTDRCRCWRFPTAKLLSAIASPEGEEARACVWRPFRRFCVVTTSYIRAIWVQGRLLSRWMQCLSKVMVVGVCTEAMMPACFGQQSGDPLDLQPSRTLLGNVTKLPFLCGRNSFDRQPALFCLWVSNINSRTAGVRARKGAQQVNGEYLFPSSPSRTVDPRCHHSQTLATSNIWLSWSSQTIIPPCWFGEYSNGLMIRSR